MWRSGRLDMGLFGALMPFLSLSAERALARFGAAAAARQRRYYCSEHAFCLPSGSL